MLIFDVDGTLYEKDRDYCGNGSILDSHEFFRYAIYTTATQNDGADEGTAEQVIEDYNKHIKQGSLLEAIARFPEAIKKEYDSLVEKHGSNGKVFVNEFGADSSFFHRMLSEIDFRNILTEDKGLQEVVSYLKQRCQLGIFTSEVYDTVLQVFNVLGLDISDFAMGAGTRYPILCSENVSDKKPGREGFDRIVEVTGVEPSEIVYVGDNLTKDVKAPLALGMNAVHVNWGGSGIVRARIVPEMHGCFEEKSYIEVPNIYSLSDIL